MTAAVVEFAYLIAAVLFIFGLRGLRSPETARRGILLVELGMLIAIGGTLLQNRLVRYYWIAAGVLVGGGIGVAMAVYIPMTKMPERIAGVWRLGGGVGRYLGIFTTCRRHRRRKNGRPRV